MIKQHDRYTGEPCVMINTMLQMSQVLRESEIGMLTAGMSTKAVAREYNVHFSTISSLQCCFREIGSTSNRPHNRRPRVWRCVGDRFADVKKLAVKQQNNSLCPMEK